MPSGIGPINQPSHSLPMERLRELWRTTVPGDSDNEVLSDVASESVFISDGWNVPYAALRLHRLEISSGKHVADVRTRSQGVVAMVKWQDRLLAATDSRLFEFRTGDLSIARPHRVVERSVVRSSTSTLVCFALPDLPTG